MPYYMVYLNLFYNDLLRKNIIGNVSVNLKMTIYISQKTFKLDQTLYTRYYHIVHLSIRIHRTII